MHEPAKSFNQAALKIKRSQILINNLGRECASFVKDKPYHISVQPDSEEGRYRFDVGLTREIPSQISLLMGDICDNLRASLDYAWMGIIRKENPSQTEKRTLPVRNNRKGLEKAIADSPIKASVKEVHVLLIDRIKPHDDFANDGNRAIVDLNRLSNWNKHNLLIATVGVTYVPKIMINSPGTRNCGIGAKVRGGICSLVGFRGAKGDLTYEGEPTVDVTFGQGDFVKDEPVIPALRNLAQATAEALHAFCEIFPDPLNPTFS